MKCKGIVGSLQRGLYPGPSQVASSSEQCTLNPLLQSLQSTGSQPQVPGT